MTKKELIEQIAEKTNTSQTTAREMIEVTMSIIKEAVNNDDPVILRGFGVFSLEMTAAKKVRDFKTGATFTRPATKKVKFKAYDNFLK